MSSSNADIEKILKFVKEVEIADFPCDLERARKGLPMLGNDIDLPALIGVNKNQGFVNGGSIQCIPACPPGPPCDDGRYDALYWPLFAQLAANKQYDRVKNTKEWYGVYTNTLMNIGMVASTFAWNHKSEFSNTVEQLCVDYLKIIMTAFLEKLTESILNSLGKPVNESALQLVNEKSSDEYGGNFQVSAGTTDVNGNLTLTAGFFTFSDKNKVKDMMFHRISSSSATWDQGNDNLVLPKPIADTVRATLLYRLQDKIKQNIMEIDI